MKMKKHLGRIFALTIFIFIFVNSAHAEDTTSLETSNSYTIYVNNSGSDSNNGSSWQYAKKTIKNATGTVASGGTVYIASGTYKGDNNRKITINKNLTIIGNGKDGTGNTTIDAEHDDYIFYIDSGFNVTILNLTLQNGEAHDTLDGHDGDPGGAIYNNGTLTVQNCNFLNNRAKDGDSPNTGSGIGKGGNGGAIYSAGTLTILSCYFESNHAGKGGDATPASDAKDGGNGGAIYSAGTLTIQNCTFKNNYAGDGGGNSGCPGSWGASGGYGGAIYIYKGTVTITDSNFNGNHAGNGHNGGNAGYAGAVYNNGTLTLQNCNLTSNFAGNGGSTKDQKNGQDGGNGGAIYSCNTLTIQNCIFDTNYAGNGGNAGDKEGGNGGDGGALYNTGHASITDSNFNGNYAGKGSDASGSSNASNGGNGGTIYNHGILTISRSEIRNSRAGTAGSAYAEQDGGDGGNGGAIYNNNTLTILNCNIHNNNATNGSNAATTGSVPGIGGCGGGIYNNGTLNITNSNMTANYAGKGGDACSNKPGAQGGNGGGIYNINLLYLQNCILDSNYAGEGGDGQGYEDGGNGGYGGGIYSFNTLGSADSLIIENCTISNNYAGKGRNAATTGSNPGVGGYGGGIYIYGNSTISNSIIHDNHAGNSGEGCSNKNGARGGDGGGIYNEGNLNLQNSSIYANSAGKGGDATELSTAGSGGNGGGVYNKNTLIITGNCQIFNNTAGQGGDGASGGNNPHGGEGGCGGAIYNEGNLTITGTSTNRVQIYNNTAGIGGTSPSFENTGGNGGKGGGIYNKKTCNVTYANIYNNTGGEGNTYTGDGDHGDINGGNGGDGGAFYNEGTLNLTESIITNNQAGAGHDGNRGGNGGNGGNGGAVANTGTLNITNCQISNNKAGNAGKGGDDYYYNKWKSTYDGGEGGLGGSGGAIYNTGTLTITGSSIIQNTAGNGGNGGKGSAVDIKSSEGDEIEIESPGDGGNGGSGGGIYNSANGTITSITNSHIDSNTAGNGGDGGLYADDLDLDLWYDVNPADAGNGGSGGGIYSAGTLKSIQNSTINGNAAGNGGNGNPVSRYPAENGGNGGNGGGLALFNDAQINYCQISNNKAGNGGNGGNTDNGNDNDSTRPGNGGNGGNGGGIYIEYPNTYMALNIAYCTIDNNAAGNGGNGGNPQQSGSGGIGGNGGGIYAIAKINPNSNYLSIFKSTITNNKAGTSGTPSINTSNGVGGGLYFNNIDVIIITFNRIVNNSPQAVYVNLSGTSVPDLKDNWWGFNQNPKDNITGVNVQLVNYSPWLILTINANPTSIKANQTSNVNANLNKDSNGNNASPDYGYTVPDGIPVSFESNIGTLNPQNSVTTNGASNTIFNRGSSYGIATVYATVDYQTVSTQIQVPSADIQVNQIVNNTRPNVGESITFTVTVKNNGPDTATNIQITDIIPPHFDHLSIYYSTGTYNGNIWTISELANGSSATFTITGTVTNAFAGLNTTNTATKTYEDQVDPNPNNDNSSATIYVPVVNIKINQHPWYYSSTTKTYQKKSDYDNTIVYFVNVANKGPDTATGIIIKEVLGIGYKFVGLSTEGVGTATYDPSTMTITWNISSMPKNTKARLSIFALVAGIGNNTPNLAVNASLSHVDQYDTPGSNKYSSWSINVDPSADIQVNQTQQTSTENDHQYVTYTVNVTNNGPNNATGIQITDPLPAGLTNPIITPVLGSYTLGSNNTLVWTIPALNVGESTTLTIKTLINGSGTFVNTATKTSQGENDWNYNNNAQTCILTVSGNYTPQVNMNIRQYPWYYRSATDSYQKISGYYQTIVYTVDVRNTGPTDATGVIVKEVLGEGYQFINCTTEGVGTATYDPSTRTITWNVGFMPKGSMAWLSIFALVTAVGNNTPELTVNASLSHVDQSDISNSRKSASYSIYVPIPTEVSIADNQSNLYITQTLNHSPQIDKGFIITFKLGNKGPDTAQHVIIKIPIPEELEFINASVDQGTWYYDQKTRTLIWYAGDVEVGDPYLYLTLKPLKQGQYTIKPLILTTTYNVYSIKTNMPLKINITVPQSNGNQVQASSTINTTKTIGMQNTGLPIQGLVLAILAILAGLTTSRKIKM